MEGGKKKIALIGVSSFLLVAMVIGAIVGVTIYVKTNNTNGHEVNTSAKAIKGVCETTDYPKACEDNLLANAGNTSDPKELVKAAFQGAVKKIQEAVRKSALLEELQKDPRTKEAVRNCVELAEAASSDLSRSFNHMGDLNANNIADVLSNLKSWLSASITYQETCLDGFQNTTGDAEKKMEDILKTSMQLTSNSLAMVNEISVALSSLQIQQQGGGGSTQRRLLSFDLLPAWFDSRVRKLLEPKEDPKIKADIVVAKDGSGKYKTINEALKHIPKHSNKTFVLYIKQGVYEEKVEFNKSMTNVMVVGDGPTKTKITGKRNFIDGTTTFHTATVVVLGDHFIAKDIGFENSAGPEKHQAVALRVGADKVIFYNCRMDGYQDTLYAHTYRQFYRNCVITGTIDFIFGDSSAVFQNCTMLIRKPLSNQATIVTAQGRKEKRQPTGIVLQNCTITADESLKPVQSEFKSYLGRPWKAYSKTIIMESYIDDLIQSDGWLPWQGTFALDTCFYAEYNNRGPAASKDNRVKWKGIKELTKTRIERYTASRFLWGDSWIPKTGVPYTPGFVFPPPPDTVKATESEKNDKTEDEKQEEKSDDELKQTAENNSGGSSSGTSIAPSSSDLAATPPSQAATDSEMLAPSPTADSPTASEGVFGMSWL